MSQNVLILRHFRLNFRHFFRQKCLNFQTFCLNFQTFFQTFLSEFQTFFRHFCLKYVLNLRHRTNNVLNLRLRFILRLKFKTSIFRHIRLNQKCLKFKTSKMSEIQTYLSENRVKSLKDVLKTS